MDNRTTVLIADSAEEFCSALSAALARADGFQILGTAGDGEQAIRMVRELKPDILILDLMLAKQDGISVLKAVSGMDKRPVTLATSGFVTDYVASAAANLGARYLMLKPCDMTALVERMEEIRVETERLRQEAEERVAQMRLEVAENLEPTRSVKNEIIEKQDALIGLLYREEDASPEIRELKREVESKKAVLQKRRALFPKL